MKVFKSLPHLSVAIASIIVALSIYEFARWEVNFTAENTTLTAEAERLRSEMVRISNKIDESSLAGRACRMEVAAMIYDLRKDTIASDQRNLTLYSNLAQTNALFLTVLLMVIVGLLFSIYQMATVTWTDIGPGQTIEIEAVKVKVKTGYVSLAVSILAIAALSIYVTGAHEVKELDTEVVVVESGLASFIEACEDHVKQTD